jgi:NADPH2:quinone reductase
LGRLVIQLATTAGATVWGQTGSQEKAQFVRELGAERVVVTSQDDLPGAVGDLQPTVVIDPLGDGFTPAAVAALAPFGRLALYGTSAGPRADVDLRTLYRKSIQLLTYSGTIEPEDRIRRALASMLEALGRGELRVPIDEALPLEAAAEAHRRIRERRVRGKLLLAP